MTKENFLTRDGKLSHQMDDITFWTQVNEDIRSHISNLRENFTVGRAMDILDTEQEFVPPTWFVNLDILSVYPFLRKPLSIYNSPPAKAISYFPKGISKISNIVRQLAILLPDTENVRAAFPVLATAYIIKYRNDMDESTRSLIYRSICSKDKSGVNNFMHRLKLEPWYQKMEKLNFKNITYKSDPMLRCYYSCILFAALANQALPETNPYLSVRIFSSHGEFGRLFFQPPEFYELQLYEESVFVTSKINETAIQILKKHLYSSARLEDLDESMDLNNTEPIIFYLRAKIDFWITKKLDRDEMESSFNSKEQIFWPYYKRLLEISDV